MSIVTDKYNAGKINMLHQLLCNDKDAGKPRDYEIKVDELKVVQRTADPEQFLNHEDFVNESTNSITITMYEGTSKRCTKYLFMLKEKPSNRDEELAGIDTKIQDKIDKEKNKWEFEKLQKENEDLKQKLIEAKEYHDGLEETITKLNGAKETQKSKITETLISLAGIYLANKPNALNGIPIIGELLGGGESNKLLQNEEPVLDTENDSEVSFKRKPPKDIPKTFTGEVDDMDYARLTTSLLPFFSSEYMKSVVHITECLSEHNQLIEQTVRALDTAINKEETTLQS